MYQDSREGWTAEEYDYYMNPDFANEEWEEDERWLEEEEELARDYMLEQQEREDFDETDEAYGFYGYDEY